MKYEQHKAKIDLEKDELTKKYNALKAEYEQKRLVLLIAEEKLYFDQGST